MSVSNVSNGASNSRITIELPHDPDETPVQFPGDNFHDTMEKMKDEDYK